MKARPTIYNGIQMRSRTEALFAGFLDSNRDVFEKWEYEPVCFASGNTQYLPDFKVWVGNGHNGFVEIGGITCGSPFFIEVKPCRPDDELARVLSDHAHMMQYGQCDERGIPDGPYLFVAWPDPKESIIVNNERSLPGWECSWAIPGYYS